MSKDYSEGFMKLYIAGDKSPNVVRATTSFRGCWIDKKTRKAILKKERWYIANVYLFNGEGQKATSTLKFKEKCNRHNLAETITTKALEIAEEYRLEGHDIDLLKSYVTVKVAKHD